MTYAENNLPGYVHNIPAEKIKTCLLTTHELSKPTDELIATCEAVFTMIRNSEMELETKNAFYRLEMQFEFYRQLVKS